MEIKINTQILDSCIIQEEWWEDPLSRTKSEITRRIINTREQQVKDALIELGWTPPKEKEPNK